MESTAPIWAPNAWKQFKLLVGRHKGISVSVLAALVVVALLTAGFVARVAQEKDLALKERDRAESALTQFKAEQAQRQADRRASAPALVETAKTLIQNKAFPVALSALTTAIEYDPALPDARVLTTALLYLQGKQDAALEHGFAYAGLKPRDSLARRLADACEIAAKKGIDAVPTGELAELLMREGVPTLAVEFTRSLEQKLPMYRSLIEKKWPGAGGGLAVSKEGRLALSMADRNDVVDLRPLLGIRGACVCDLSPLQGMVLTDISFDPPAVTQGMDAIRRMKSLLTINNLSPADFWKKYDAGEFGRPVGK